jgi:hypothetical protein
VSELVKHSDFSEESSFCLCLAVICILLLKCCSVKRAHIARALIYTENQKEYEMYGCVYMCVYVCLYVCKNLKAVPATGRGGS